MNDVWEERKLEILKMFGNRVVLGLEDFTEKTQKDYEGKEWIDIGNKKIWINRCPCGKVRLFRYTSTYNSSKDSCYRCAMIKHNQSDKMRTISSICKLGNENHFCGLKGSLNPAYKLENREKISKALKGRKCPWLKNNQYAKGNKLNIEARLIISKTHKGKSLSEEHKNKIKISMRKQICKNILERSKTGQINNIGKNESIYFSMLEKQNEWMKSKIIYRANF